MDSAHRAGDMSPLYVPRKRKSVQPRSGVPCPVVQRIPERAGELTPGQLPERAAASQEAARIKQTCGRKRYEELQNVAMGTVDYPTTSCSVLLSGGLANGAEPGSMAPPTARLPPRLGGKEAWPQGGRDLAKGPNRDAWDPRRDRAGHSGQEPAWDRTQGGPRQAWPEGRDRGPQQDWDRGGAPERGGASEGHEQGWSPRRVQDQSWSQTGREQGNVWRPDMNMKKVQRGETGRSSPVSNVCPPPGGRDSSPAGSGPAQTSSVRLCADRSPSVVVVTKKEPPSYPAGSQEERWQLQIAAKGRATCPKCRSVSRKTVEGLRKHLDNCRQQPFSCPHCGKQLKSSTGMKYHIMADHSHLPSAEDSKDLDDRAIKDKLRKILKRLGKLKCSKEGCSAAFTSIMGYVYHMKKCGKEEAELQKMLLSCSHCGKTYRSKAGLEYHLRSEHAPTPQRSEEDEAPRAPGGVDPERTASGRVQRASAQVANFHLAEIANNELPKDWPKRKFQCDLVPDDKKLKYARPGLPAFSQEVLRKWKNEVKLQRRVHCPNQGCGCTYTSVSGLKAHLGLCTKGDFEAGKYRCLICNKEFHSESGVKYHIKSVHSQDWFVTNKKASKKFEKFLRNPPPPPALVRQAEQQSGNQYHHQHHHMLQHHHHHHHHHHHQHPQPLQLQPLQLQPLQHPLQPLHHLQHQPQFLHPPQGEQQLHYTPLEPPAGPMWVELDHREDVPGPEQAPIDMDLDVMDKQDQLAESEEAGSGVLGVERRDERWELKAADTEEAQEAGRRRSSSHL